MGPTPGSTSPIWRSMPPWLSRLRIFVVAIDFGRTTTMPREMLAPIYRLALIGGAFLAVIVVLVPFLNHLATYAAGRVIPLSGFEAVLLVALILAIVGALEQSGKKGGGVPVLASRLP